MNQGMYGDFQRYQESPGMNFETTRLHKTWFQKGDFLKNLKILSELWPWRSPCALIQDLGWIQLESTLKIIVMNVENSSFGYHLTLNLDLRGFLPCCLRTFWFSNSVPWRRVLRTILSSDGLGPLAWGPSDFTILTPGRRVLRTTNFIACQCCLKQELCHQPKLVTSQPGKWLTEIRAGVKDPSVYACMRVGVNACHACMRWWMHTCICAFVHASTWPLTNKNLLCC